MRASRHHLALWGLHHAARFYGPKFAQYLLGPVGAVAGSVWTARELYHLYRKYKTQEMRLPWTSRPAKRRKTSRSEIMPVNTVQPSDGMFTGQKISYYSKRGGKRLSKKQKLLANLSSHVQPIIERFQRATQYAPSNSTLVKSGTYPLTAGNDVAERWNWPVFLYDITGVFNQNSHDTNIKQRPNVAYRVVSDATGTTHDYLYFPVTGETSNGATNYTWEAEKVFRQTSAVPFAGQSTFIDTVALKAAVFGALEVPSEVYVELWRFTDEKIVPPQMNTTTVGTLPTTDYDTIDQERLNGFWTYMLSKQVGTMDNDQNDSINGDGVYIKRLWTFKFGPQDSSNPDPSSAVRTLTLRHNVNRYVKLDWNTGQDSEEILPAEVGNPLRFDPDNSVNMVCTMPNQKSRMFIVVRGDVSQTHTTGLTATQRNALYPSFDLVLRRFRTMVHT